MVDWPDAHRVFAPAERPLAEVFVDGTWWPAEIRDWQRWDDGRRGGPPGWYAGVSWHRGIEIRLDHFHETHVRRRAQEDYRPSGVSGDLTT